MGRLLLLPCSLAVSYLLCLFRFVWFLLDMALPDETSYCLQFGKETANARSYTALSTFPAGLYIIVEKFVLHANTSIVGARSVLDL